MRKKGRSIKSGEGKRKRQTKPPGNNEREK